MKKKEACEALRNAVLYKEWIPEFSFEERLKIAKEIIERRH